MAAPEPFVVGSTHLLEVWIKDVVNGVPTPMALSPGSTVPIRVQRPDDTVVIWNATADMDQTANKGKATYQMAAVDLPLGGLVRLQGRPGTLVTKIVNRYAVRAIA